MRDETHFNILQFSEHTRLRSAHDHAPAEELSCLITTPHCPTQWTKSMLLFRTRDQIRPIRSNLPRSNLKMQQLPRLVSMEDQGKEIT